MKNDTTQSTHAQVPPPGAVATSLPPLDDGSTTALTTKPILSDFDLRKMAEEWLGQLENEQLLEVAKRLLNTAKVAKDLLNQTYAVIMRQIREPHLPLTNNVAEQALRHWVIARRINQDTRSAAGTRAYALAASVIETCRSPTATAWCYINEVVAAARSGRALPKLPPIPVGV